MHIAMITPFPSDTGSIDGGVAGVAQYLAEEMAKRDGIRLTIIDPRARTGDKQIEQWERYTIYRLGVPSAYAKLPGTVYDMVAGNRELYRLLGELKPDIAHFQAFDFAAAQCPVPHILTIHGIGELDALWLSCSRVERLFRWLLLKAANSYGRRRVPYVIIISEYVRQFLKTSGNLRKAWLIENPVADMYFTIPRRPAGESIFACGRVIPRKNILGLIAAFARAAAQHAGAQLRIAGSLSVDPGYAAQCRRLAETCGFGRQIHFLGNLSIEQVQQELAACACLAIPSFQETAPLAIEEAMAMGVPVVGAHICGLPYMIEEGRTGYLVDPASTEEISAALIKILADEGLAARMSRRARELAQRRFKASDVAVRTLSAYREVLEDRNKQ